MSTTHTPSLFPPPPPPLTTTIGLGYYIAIALGFLVLLSVLLLGSYLCCRRSASIRHHHHLPDDTPNAIYLPRIVFVAEDDEESNVNVPIGLDHAVINSYPRFIYSKKTTNDHQNDISNVRFVGNNETMCPICLCEYRESEMLRMLPDCRHYFHVTCVDAWLKLNATCPVCRSSPLPTPLSTPLSEVVPSRSTPMGGGGVEYENV